MSYLNLIADDKRLITYRPSLNKITGSVLGTIFLQQVLYWYKKNGSKPFYKFNAPCNDEKYRPGDSWQEELGFTRSEFETARKAVAQKKEKGSFPAGAFVVYWQDINRLTWYTINAEALEKAFSRHYEMQDSNITEMQESSITEMQDSDILYLSENTTKSTQREEKREAKLPVTPPLPPPPVSNHFEREETDGQKAAIAQMNGITRKHPLTVALENITIGVSSNKLLSAAYQLHQLGATQEDLIGFPEWSAKNNLKGLIYPSQVVNNWLKYKPAAGVKVSLQEALGQLRGIAHLQNGQFSAAWGQLPEGVRVVLSGEAKRQGCKAIDLLKSEFA